MMQLYQNQTSSGTVVDEGKTNHFIYKENINAAYINYNRQIKKWGVQAGLRAENTNAHGHQLGQCFTSGFFIYQKLCKSFSNSVCKLSDE